MTGAEHVLDAEDGGLFPAMSDEFDYALVSKGLGETYELMYMDNKPYPCCRSTHCAIDAALTLRSEGVAADQIASVEVGTYLVGNKQCGMSEGSCNPVKPTDAKFSTPYTVACSILFGEVTLRQFEQEIIENPQVRALVKKVKVVSEDRFTSVYPDHWGCEVRVLLTNGETVSKLVRDASGSVDNPLSTDQVKSKASALIRETRGEDTPRIVSAVLGIAEAGQLPEI
jgi:2-methylcitrate dehydratase PrpD